MSIYYGLIIPRSYNDYINKSQPEEFRKAMNNTGLIPNAASEENQLADKNFVNSTVGTNTANYIYKTESGGEKVPFSSIAELEAYTGTVTHNDYAFVTGTDENGNIYFDRYKANVDGDVVTWAKEYRLNNSSFTADQWAAIQSGITAELVEKFNAAAVPAVDKVEAGEMAPVTSNAVNGALANYQEYKMQVIKNGDANNCIPHNNDKIAFYRGTMNNTPFSATVAVILTSKYYYVGSYENVYQEVEQYGDISDKYTPIIYIRYGYKKLTETEWAWCEWQKLTHKEKPILKVCNYNVGKWNDGVTRPDTADVERISIDYHRFLGDFDADIITMEEAYDTIDSAETINAYDKIFKFKYPYKYKVTTGNSAANQLFVCSKEKLNDFQILLFNSGSQRPYATFYQIINGKKINFILTHLSIETTPTYRTQDLTELKQILSSYEYGILLGDFNTYTIDEFNIFSNDFTMANHGEFGDYETWGIGITTNWNKCLDNIIVTKNIKLQNVMVGSNYNISDHKPIMSFLEI